MISEGTQFLCALQLAFLQLSNALLLLYTILIHLGNPTCDDYLAQTLSCCSYDMSHGQHVYTARVIHSLLTRQIRPFHTVSYACLLINSINHKDRPHLQSSHVTWSPKVGSCHESNRPPPRPRARCRTKSPPMPPKPCTSGKANRKTTAENGSVAG